ncbi:Ribonucleoside-diphosphate reductase large subunit [uncultured virus]|nr:Ribonucleoside-diphosphate reductase large subunit [uncultured virus]
MINDFHKKDQYMTINNNNIKMEVIKRNGEKEKVSFDKIIMRIEGMCKKLNLTRIDVIEIAKQTVQGIYDGITTEELDFFAAHKCAEKIWDDPQYNNLAAGLCTSNLHKNTDKNFLQVTQKLYFNKDNDGNSNPLVTEEYFNNVTNNIDLIENAIDYNRDYNFDFFGIKTLERSYLMRLKNAQPINDKNKLKNNKLKKDKKKLKQELILRDKYGKIVERPQQMFMRVSLGIHGNDINKALQTYNFMSKRYFTHASPTLYNAGTKRPQMSSCFLLNMNDSIEGIFETITDVAKISKYAGGIGITISNIRASGSIIRSTNGNSDGIIPCAQTLNAVGRYVNQCFVPQTIVFGKNGPIEMEYINEGDFLFTIDGTLKRVNQIIKNKINKKIYEINITNSIETVKVTGEHQIYVIPNQIKIDFNIILERLNSGMISPIYKSVENLTIDDIVCFPKPNYEVDNIFDYDHHKFYGLMLGHGYMIKNENTLIMECGILLNSISKSKALNFAYQYLKSKKIHYFVCVDELKNVILKWNFSHKLNLNFDEIYNKDLEKFIDIKYLNLPKNKIKFLLRGLFGIDDSSENEIYFISSSKQLTYQIRYILLKFGFIPSGFITNCEEYNQSKEKKIQITKKIAYKLKIPINLFDEKPILEINHFEYDNKIWTNINSINKIDYNGEVIDFNMQDNHNYLTNMGLVHNSGRRNGAIALYLEPWHADIYDFCELRKNTGSEELRARDIFLALWIPDIFMKRVEEKGLWSLMCPDECPGLTTSYGDAFENLYLSYEQNKKYKRQVKAEDLWFHILSAQIETGMPYMLYKDNINKQSNQKNIGVIQSSNLCVSGDTFVLTEIGPIEIQTLENKNVNIWNGQEWSNVLIKKTGIKKNLITVKFSNGSELNCTAEHKFYIKKNKTIIEKSAIELETNEYLIDYNLPNFDNNIKILDELQKIYDNNIATQKLKYNIFYISYNKNELIKLKQLLQLIGIESLINKNNDNFGNSKNNYLLTINEEDFTKLIEYGFKSKRYDPKETCTYNQQRNEIYIKSIKKSNIFADTYCFTEPKRHMGMFNGILTGQCAEIVEYTSPDEIAVCNLSSICLPTFIENGEFNFDKLYEISKIVTENLNKIIDINFYPVDKAKTSNLKHRPIGIGVQGLADVFCILNLPFDSDQAMELNQRIFETIYYGSLTSSNELARQYGPYDTFQGSPFSEGKLQFHLWDLDKKKFLMHWDWTTLIENIKRYGTRNSLLTAIMPTASTSQLMGFNESVEPFTTNLYTRTTLAGEYVVVNKYLVEKLIGLGLWTKEIRDEFLYDKGSIQLIDEVPNDLKNVYKTAFEMKIKPIVQHAIMRGPFIDQTQSMNIFLDQPDFQKLMSSHFYGWKNKLKTGMYYLRTRPTVDAIKFGLDPVVINKIEKKRNHDLNSIDSDNSDEEKFDQRRLNEIDQNHKKHILNINKKQDHLGCDVCSG